MENKQNRFLDFARCVKRSLKQRFTDDYPRRFICKSESHLIYLNNPKVACSSIKASMFKDFENYQDIHKFTDKNYLVFQLTTEMKDYYKFTFVRNPFERLVSCYEDKIVLEKSILFKYYKDEYACLVSSFDDFVKWVVRIPHPLAEPHFVSQYYLIYNKWGKCLVDYVGHIENIENEYESIRARFGLKPLPHKNRVASLIDKNWKDYYTLETAELVYKKYKKDFKAFGYEAKYKELMEYLR